jgi:lysophospholipase L1-like esterase
MTINVLTGFRPLGLTAVLGDSRVAQIFTSQTVGTGGQVPATVGGYNHFNWGNARSGHRLKIAYNGGLSGDRSDQMLARLLNCYTSVTGCGHLYIHVGVNDIAQSAGGYTTANVIGPNQATVVSAANVAAVCFANIQYAAQQFLAHGGRIVTVVLEPGAENYTATQIGNAIDLNQRLREFAEVNQQVVLFDLWKEMHDPSLSSASTIRFKAGYAQEASGSGTHQSNLGGYKVGIPFNTFITANFPPVVVLPGDINEIPSTSLTNQLLSLASSSTSSRTTAPRHSI